MRIFPKFAWSISIFFVSCICIDTISSDILASTIRLCVYPIDFSIYAACPRAHEDSRELSVCMPINRNIRLEELRRTVIMY